MMPPGARCPRQGTRAKRGRGMRALLDFIGEALALTCCGAHVLGALALTVWWSVRREEARAERRARTYRRNLRQRG